MGLLAAICNDIPYAGFIIGLVPPALLVPLIGDWHLMILLIRRSWSTSTRRPAWANALIDSTGAMRRESDVVQT